LSKTDQKPKTVEELAKGAIRRIFGKFDRDDPGTIKARGALDDWQHTIVSRDAAIAVGKGRPQEASEMQRGFNKLASQTKMRRNPETGEREFLLHRGVGQGEKGDTYLTSSSWTPHYTTAHRFAIDNTPMDVARTSDPPTMSRLAHGRVKSAWVPDKHIKIIANQLNPKGAYREENEVLVAPHKLQIADPSEVVEAKAGVHGSGVPAVLNVKPHLREPHETKEALQYKRQSRLKRAMGKYSESLKKDDTKTPATIKPANSLSDWGEPSGAATIAQPQAPATEPPPILNGLEHKERRWPAHNIDLYHGIEMKNMHFDPATGHGKTRHIIFAGRPNDTKPRVILKDSSIPEFSSKDAGNETSYLLHPTFMKAHREAAYHKVAGDVFGLDKYVPRTAVFRHPKTGEPWSAQELVPGAEEVMTSDLEPLRHNGDLHKLAIMNTILGNHDRHENNILKDQHGNIKLIDHGLAFDYNHVTTNVLPHYAMHVLDEDVPQHVHDWVQHLDATKLADHLHRLGAPHDIVMTAVHRLNAAKEWSHFIETAEQKHGVPPRHPGMGYLLEKLRLHRIGGDPELRRLKSERINHYIMNGEPHERPNPQAALVSTLKAAKSKSTGEHE